MRIIEKPTTEKKKVYLHGGKIPEESAERLRSLLSLASSQLLFFCNEKFYEGIGQEAAQFSFELKLSSTGIKAKRVDKSKTKHTIVFKYPTESSIQTALDYRSFLKFIRG